MRKKKFFTLALPVILFLFSSCTRTGDDVWEDTKSASRHMGRGVRTLGGKNGDSRQVRSRNEFESIDEDAFNEMTGIESTDYGSDFIPMDHVDYQEVAMADMVSPPPKESPGDPGSSIPGIEYFRDPQTIPELSRIFRPIYFDYNSSLVTGDMNIENLKRMSDYLHQHPNFYLYIEGHTDERGPQAYNFALGLRRAIAIRNYLINRGINPDNLFTTSYGKERPVVLDKHEEGYAKNRRGEFKFYVR